jgi:hypothetical protein
MTDLPLRDLDADGALVDAFDRLGPRTRGDLARTSSTSGPRFTG